VIAGPLLKPAVLRGADPIHPGQGEHFPLSAMPYSNYPDAGRTLCRLANSDHLSDNLDLPCPALTEGHQSADH